MDYHGGTVEYFRHYVAESLMLSPPILHAVGLATSPERLTLRLKLPTGEALEVDIDVDRDSSARSEDPWRLPTPGAPRR